MAIFKTFVYMILNARKAQRGNPHPKTKQDEANQHINSTGEIGISTRGSGCQQNLTNWDTNNAGEINLSKTEYKMGY
jgi:hypothetical protein